MHKMKALEVCGSAFGSSTCVPAVSGGQAGPLVPAVLRVHKSALHAPQRRPAEQALRLRDPATSVKNDPSLCGCRDHRVFTWNEQQIE